MTRHILKLFDGTTVDLGLPIDIFDSVYERRQYTYRNELPRDLYKEVVRHSTKGHILYHAIVTSNGTEFNDNVGMINVYATDDLVTVAYPINSIKSTKQRMA